MRITAAHGPRRGGRCARKPWWRKSVELAGIGVTGTALEVAGEEPTPVLWPTVNSGNSNCEECATMIQKQIGGGSSRSDRTDSPDSVPLRTIRTVPGSITPSSRKMEESMMHIQGLEACLPRNIGRYSKMRAISISDSIDEL
jgi:hypothetical protein